MSEINSSLYVEKTHYSGFGLPKTVSGSWQMFYMENGVTDITIDSHVYHIESGMMAFVSPDEFVYTYDNKFKIISAVFEVTGNNIFGSSHKIVRINENQTHLLKLLLNSTEKDDIEKQTANTAIQLLMLMSAKAEGISPLSKKRDASVFKKSAEILNSNIKSQISVTDLANKLDISLSHLKRIFANYTALGVHEYHLFLKIREAKKLLSDGVSVTSTAELTGFSNQAYFSSAFKRITGLSPKTFSVKRPTGKIGNSSDSKPKDLPSYLL